MDPITPGIISGLVVNAISKIASPLAASRAKRTWGKLPSYGPLALSVAAKLESTNLNNNEKQKVCDFNRTDLAATTVRTILIAIILGPVEGYASDIRSCVSAALSFYGGMSPSSAEEGSRILFETYTAACNSAWEAIRDDDTYRAAVSAASREYLAGQLSNISATRDAYARVTLQDMKKYQEFERKLRSQIRDRHKSIEPPDLDRKLEVPFNQLYVIPDLVSMRSSDEESASEKSSSDRKSANIFIRQLYRDVVVGDPGAGKSTLGLKLVNDVSALEEEFTPFIVILRDYAKAKRTSPCSIMEFVEQVSNSNYQVKAPAGAVEFLLHRGRLVLVFDGLDELLDTSDRREISSDVESFANLYPNTPMLVTSRKVGYEQAPLNDSIFNHLELEEMSTRQVRQYASSWFALRSSQGEALKLTEAFMGDSSEIADLRANSLMLGLLCNLYRTQRHIPRNRADVYRSCAVMLFTRWDQSRGIAVQLPFRAHIDAAIKHLAYWIYTSQDRQSGIGRSKLIAQVSEFLMERRYDDEDEAIEAATQFIDFCGGRAWILTDVGSTTREPLYQFTHRTFLEYFTAAHIARINPTPSRLWQRLHGKLEREEWTMVGQLALQLQEENVEGFADDFFGYLLDSKSTVEESQRKALLRFALESLSGVVPSRSTVREIVLSGLQEDSLNSVQHLNKIAFDNARVAADATNTWLQGLPEISINDANDGADINSLSVAARELLTWSYVAASYWDERLDSFQPDEFIRQAWNLGRALSRGCALDLRAAIGAVGLGFLDANEFLERYNLYGIIFPQQISPFCYLSPITPTLFTEFFGLPRKLVAIASGSSEMTSAIADLARTGWVNVRLTALPPEEEWGDEPRAGVGLLNEIWPKNSASFEKLTEEQQYTAIFLMCLMIDLYGSRLNDIGIDRSLVAHLLERSKFVSEEDRAQVRWWLEGNRLAPEYPERESTAWGRRRKAPRAPRAGE